MATARRGMTLIEVMVVILILGVLMGLFFPMIRRSQLASRRNRCAQNLQQIGLAMLNYESAMATFPIGAMGRHGKGYPLAGDPTGANNRRSWSHLVLPFLEETALYNAINFHLSFDDVANTTATRRTVRAYLCPADGGSAARIDAGRKTERPRGNYAVNWGNTHFDQAGGPDPFAGPLGNVNFGGAPFGYDMSVPIRQIIDGANNTLLMSELINPPSATDPADRRGDLANDDPNAAMFMGYSTPNSATPDQVPKVTGSAGCVASGKENPCNRMSPAFNAARSYHPGGVNAMMADGSVRFLLDSIDVATWQGISTSRGTADTGPFSY